MKKIQITLAIIFILSIFSSGCKAQVEEETLKSQQENNVNQGQEEQEQASTKNSETEQTYKLEINGEDVFLSQHEYTELMAFFKNYDTNGDGFVDRQEFKAMSKDVDESVSIHPSSDEELTDLIAMVDFDQDGILSFSEFISLGFLGEDILGEGNDDSETGLNEEKQTITQEKEQFIPDDL